MYGGGFGNIPPDPLFTGGTVGPAAGMGGNRGEAVALAALLAGETLMIMPTIPIGLDIPPGLEYLFTIGSAHVQQKTDLVEMTTNIDTPNKYMIYNDQGQFIYFAQEVQTGGEFVAAQMVGDSRGFRIRVTDAMGRTVFTIFRSSKLWTNCEMIVEAPPGTPCGYASFQANILCRGVMTIMDQFRRPILTIPFPSERDAHLSDRGYPLMMGGLLVGAIIRKFPGFAKQIMTNCDNFALTFPAELEPRVKCVLLACAILIDFIDFEDKRDVTRGKNKNVSPQARASLGNPFQASVNVVPVATVSPMYGGGCGIGNIPADPLFTGGTVHVAQRPVVQVMQPVQQVAYVQQAPGAYPVQQQQYQQQRPMQQQQPQQYQQQPQQYQQQGQQYQQQQPQQQYQQNNQGQQQPQQYQQQPQQQGQQYQQQPQQQPQQYQQQGHQQQQQRPMQQPPQGQQYQGQQQPQQQYQQNNQGQQQPQQGQQYQQQQPQQQYQGQQQQGQQYQQNNQGQQQPQQQYQQQSQQGQQYQGQQQPQQGQQYQQQAPPQQQQLPGRSVMQQPQQQGQQQQQGRSVMQQPKGATNVQSNINQRQQTRVTTQARPTTPTTPSGSKSLGAAKNTPQKSVYADKKKKK